MTYKAITSQKSYFPYQLAYMYAYTCVCSCSCVNINLVSEEKCDFDRLSHIGTPFLSISLPTQRYKLHDTTCYTNLERKRNRISEKKRGRERLDPNLVRIMHSFSALLR